MLIYAVDDELLALRSLTRAIREAAPDCTLREFAWGRPMLEAAAVEAPDVAFIDVEMPGMSGVEAAKRLKSLAPRVWIIFVTGFSDYAVDAFAIHAKGYVMKPVTAKAIREELDAPAPAPLTEKDVPRVRITAFGNFTVSVNGGPLEFSRAKAKEMLAYLVHRCGAECGTQELAAVLFEDGAGGKLDYFFKIAQCLRRTLDAAGCGDILRHSYKNYAIDPEKIDCDYYRFLAAPADARDAFTGEYMAQYSWAESIKQRPTE